MLCKHEVVGSIPTGSTSRLENSSMRTLIRTDRMSIVCVLSDIVKRGSYQAYEHEKSCALRTCVAATACGSRHPGAASFVVSSQEGRREAV